MPIIIMDGPQLTKDEKAKLVREFTKIASEVTQLPKVAFTVLINERDRDNVGVGGELLSDKMAKS